MYCWRIYVLTLCFVLSIWPTTTERADFHSDGILSTITFGSCNKHDLEQNLWSKIMEKDPDLWIWLGDAVYADTTLLPFLWMPSSLERMKEIYNLQRERPEYKVFVDSKVPIVGVWDDHDYGIDGGGKSFKYRLQAQKIFLDFVDEPTNSIRRTREGTYASYTYGTGDQIVKIILLDVRSHYIHGSNCDTLGDAQWHWLDQQLNDSTSNLIFIGTGKQVLTDFPIIDKWMSCPSSLDKLVHFAQKRSNVIFLSGDVHFSEVNCLNSSGTGYPLYEVTSSGLTHSCSASLLGICNWTLKHVVSSRYRVSKVVTDKNFGAIKIDWNSNPGSTVSPIKDVARSRLPSPDVRCPTVVTRKYATPLLLYTLSNDANEVSYTNNGIHLAGLCHISSTGHRRTSRARIPHVILLCEIAIQHDQTATIPHPLPLEPAQHSQ